MKPFLCFFIFFMLTINCHAQKTFINYHDNGNISEKGNIKNGKKVGDYISYYISGNPKIEAKFVEGFIIEKKEYSESGRLIKSAYMVNGSDKIQVINYDSQGHILSKGFLDNKGLRTGEWNVFSDEKNIYQTYIYEDGLIINHP